MLYSVTVPCHSLYKNVHETGTRRWLFAY